MVAPEISGGYSCKTNKPAKDLDTFQVQIFHSAWFPT